MNKSIDYSIEINEADASLLPVSNIGAYSIHDGSSSDLKIFSTSSEGAYKEWCKALVLNNCEYKDFSSN